MLLLLLEHRILCLVRLIDRMKLMKQKLIRILSDGSLHVCYKYCTTLKQIEIYTKDNKNFYLNEKKIDSRTKLEPVSNFKKKYLI